jgi:hypothetical protein
MTRGNILVWPIFLLLIMGTNSYAQTCCSGGVPLSANIGLPVSDKGSWQFSLNYDYNQLKTLMDGNKELDDGIRERLTQSILFETGYTFSKRISLDLFLSFVRQERNIFTPFGTNSTITNGIGDGVLLFKFNILPENLMTTALFGFGPKIPFGPTDRTSDRGISLPADLQPGSGAWDAVIWGTVSRSLNFRHSMSVYVTSTYRATGVNPDYLGSLAYEFGNDFLIIAGIADRIAIGSSVWDPSLSFRYRKAQRDKTNNVDLAGTGGEWVFMMPGLKYSITSDISINVIMEFPLYSFVNETQLTPTKRFTAGIYYKINKLKL